MLLEDSTKARRRGNGRLRSQEEEGAETKRTKRKPPDTLGDPHKPPQDMKRFRNDETKAHKCRQVGRKRSKPIRHQVPAQLQPFISSKRETALPNTRHLA